MTEGVATGIVTPLLSGARRASAFTPLARAWVRPVALAAVAALPTLVAARLLAIDTLLEFTAVGAVWAVVYGAVFWRWGLDDRERGTLWRAFTGGGGAAAGPRRRGLAERAPVDVGGRARHPLDRELTAGAGEPAFAQPLREAVVGQHPRECGCERSGIVGRYEQARLAVDDDLRDRAHPRGHNRQLSQHRLQEHEPNPSQRAGWTSSSARRSQVATSPARPGSRNELPRPSSRPSCSSRSRSGPSPKIRSTASG